MCKMNADNFIICGGMIEKLKKINPQYLQLDFGKLYQFVLMFTILFIFTWLNYVTWFWIYSEKTILLTLCTLSWQLLDYKVNWLSDLLQSVFVQNHFLKFGMLHFWGKMWNEFHRSPLRFRLPRKMVQPDL